MFWGPSAIGSWHFVQFTRALDRRDLEAAEAVLPRLMEWKSAVGAAEVEFLSARLARKQGNLQEANRRLETAEVLGADRERIRRERMLMRAQGGDIREFEQELGQLLIDPRGDAREICEAYANGLLTNFRLAEIGKILELWQADYPDDPMPWLIRGRLEEHSNRWKEAGECYQNALGLNPKFLPAIYGLARIAVGRNQFADAGVFYQRCIDASRAECVPALVGLAFVKRSQQQYGPARALLERAGAATAEQCRLSFRSVGEPAEFAPLQPIAELAHLELAEGHFERVIELLSPALEAYPQQHGLRNTLATAYRAIGKIDEAKVQLQLSEDARRETAGLDALRDQLGQRPEDTTLRREIGRIMLQHLSAEQGLIWLHGALYFDPRSQETHRILAEYYEQQARRNPAFQGLAERHRQLAGPAETLSAPSSPRKVQP